MRHPGGVKETWHREPASTDPLIALYFRAEQGSCGQIVALLCERLYVVAFFSSPEGYETLRRIVSLDRMKSWSFFATDSAFREARPENNTTLALPPALSTRPRAKRPSMVLEWAKEALLELVPAQGEVAKAELMKRTRGQTSVRYAAADQLVKEGILRERPYRQTKWLSRVATHDPELAEFLAGTGDSSRLRHREKPKETNSEPTDVATTPVDVTGTETIEPIAAAGTETTVPTTQGQPARPGTRTAGPRARIGGRARKSPNLGAASSAKTASESPEPSQPSRSREIPARRGRVSHQSAARKKRS